MPFNYKGEVDNQLVDSITALDKVQVLEAI
jgi:hypothetical protein